MPKIAVLKPRLQAQQRTAVATWTDDQRIRGTTLANIRKAHFERHPLCVRCIEAGVTRIAVELDHVIPLHQGGKDSKDPFENRQGLCREHHELKSQQEMGNK